MGSEWNQFQFEDAPLQILDGDRGKNYPNRKEFTSSGHCIFLNTGNVTREGFNFSELEFISEERDQLLRKGKLQRQDVVLTTRGTIGNVAYFSNHIPYEHIRINSGMVILRADQKQLDPRFLYLFLRSRLFTAQVEALRTGSAQPQLPIRDIKKVIIVLPDLTNQQAIAHILGSLDDKIELNRQMNATLESMAQALFKSWFVDFDPVIDKALAEGNPIPDPLQKRADVRRALDDKRKALPEHIQNQFPSRFIFTGEVGWIPEGWKILELENTTSVIIDHRGKTPQKLGTDWAESGFPAVSAKNIKNGKLVRRDTIRFTDSELYERWMPQELKKGDMLMTSEAPLGEKLYLAKQVKWVLSQRLFGLRANGEISGVYLYHWLNTATAKTDIEGRASGTTVQGIKQSELRKVKVLVPSKDCITSFSEASDSLMKKRSENEENTEELIKLRDTLLPKLISGQIRIPDASNL